MLLFSHFRSHCLFSTSASYFLLLFVVRFSFPWTVFFPFTFNMTSGFSKRLDVGEIRRLGNRWPLAGFRRLIDRPSWRHATLMWTLFGTLCGIVRSAQQSGLLLINIRQQFIFLSENKTCTQSLSFLVHSNWETGASERHSRAENGRTAQPCSLQSRARSRIWLAPVSQLLWEKKGTACSLRWNMRPFSRLGKPHGLTIFSSLTESRKTNRWA